MNKQPKLLRHDLDRQTIAAKTIHHDFVTTIHLH